eukprot:jgi/Botrbrau1/3020/Bobra.0070s0016.1
MEEACLTRGSTAAASGLQKDLHRGLRPLVLQFCRKPFVLKGARSSPRLQAAGSIETMDSEIFVDSEKEVLRALELSELTAISPLDGYGIWHCLTLSCLVPAYFLCNLQRGTFPHISRTTCILLDVVDNPLCGRRHHQVETEMSTDRKF